jgi:hypothetical protein
MVTTIPMTRATGHNNETMIAEMKDEIQPLSLPDLFTTLTTIKNANESNETIRYDDKLKTSIHSPYFSSHSKYAT